MGVLITKEKEDQQAHQVNILSIKVYLGSFVVHFHGSKF
jgi:hypothetical protein